MNAGDRVLVRARPMLGPMIVDRVRTEAYGEPEVNGPVSCRSNGTPRGFLGKYDQAELVPCPPEYEVPPPADQHWLALGWLNRNRALLETLHGTETVALAERRIRERILLKERIDAALAAEPGAGAMRQAEIAFGQLGRAR
jgi:hypothetical protein